MLNHFENIPKITDNEFQSMVICKHCGRLVETGVMNLVNHIDHCDAYWKTVPVVDMSEEGCRNAIRDFIKNANEKAR
jgi:hypothetical protein